VSFIEAVPLQGGILASLDLHSGNSRCRHERGTQLKPEEKKALIEYLKTL
jgi:hypothetical protein